MLNLLRSSGPERRTFSGLIMRILIGVAFVAATSAAHAQPVLNRTNPTQEEKTGRPDVPAVSNVVPLAVEQPAEETIGERMYSVGAIVIDGKVLRTADFLDIIDRYSARSLTSAQLAEVVDAVAERAQARGYIFAASWIEPQSLGAGLLRIRLDEGAIDAIRIVGDDGPAVRAQLEPLRSGQPVTLPLLQRHVLLADDLPGVYIRRTRYEREGELGVLIVDAVRSGFVGRIALENDGSRPIGPVRARLDVGANGLLSPFDELNLTVSTTPFQPSELQYGRVRYAMVVSRSGTQIAVTGSYSATEPGAYLAGRDIFGQSWRVGAQIRQPIRRSQDNSVWLEGDFELSELRQERQGVLERRDRIPVARLSLYSLAALAGGQLRGRATLSRGIGILGASEPGDPLASRDDASAAFTTLSGWMEWDRAISERFSVKLGGQGQVSTRPLLATEDIGLGGTRFLRGYNFSERAGDRGIMGYGELRYDLPAPLRLVRRVQFYSYVDGGVVGNLESGRGSGSLASAGGGIRTDVRRGLVLDTELAFPLTGSRYDTRDMSPRPNLRLSHAF